MQKKKFTLEKDNIGEKFRIEDFDCICYNRYIEG